jgi:hypothetical protein
MIVSYRGEGLAWATVRIVCGIHWAGHDLAYAWLSNLVFFFPWGVYSHAFAIVGPVEAEF